MITLGYGDIVPTTSQERIYVIFVTLISCGVFAYSLNAIGGIVQEITKKNSDFRMKMGNLRAHMRQRGISGALQMRVNKYYQYLNEEQLKDNEGGQMLLNQCTSALKKEVLTEMYGKLLMSKKEFRLNFSKEFLITLAPKLKEKRHSPEEIIFNEQQFNKCVYFVMRGNIILQKNTNF